jgi:hypothetical protein
MILFFLTTGCSNTRIIHSWNAKNVSGKKYKRVLVIGLFRNEDSLLRQNIENQFIMQFRKIGIEGVPWSELYGSSSFEAVKQDIISDSLKASNADGILTITLLNKKKEYYYINEKVVGFPGVYFDRHFWGYYTSVYDRIYVPAYYTHATRYFWEGNFFDMETKKLIYSSQTESFDENSAEDVVPDYGNFMIRDLLKKQILFVQTTTPDDQNDMTKIIFNQYPTHFPGSDTGLDLSGIRSD